MDPETREALQIALGSCLVGFGVATTLYGITCMQIYLYYRNYPKDPLYIKLIVFALWILDTLGTVFIAHTLYWYLVPNIGVADVAFIIPWSYAAQSETVDVITLITQCFFAWQIWKVGKNAIVSCSIVVLSIAAWALDIKVVVSMFRDNSGLTLANPVVLICGTAVQGIDALCDIIITASFIYYLRSFRNGIKPTEKLVDTLILYAVSRGVLTVVTQVVFVSLDAALPGRLYWLPFQQAVGKLYVNSVLASLNSRKKENVPTAVVNVTETAMNGRGSSVWGNGMRASNTIRPMLFSANPNETKSITLSTIVSIPTDTESNEERSSATRSTAPSVVAKVPESESGTGFGGVGREVTVDVGRRLDLEKSYVRDISTRRGPDYAGT